MKLWMVLQSWKVNGMWVDVRSVVPARNRKHAEQGADEACRVAADRLARRVGMKRNTGKPAGKAQVMYQIQA